MRLRGAKQKAESLSSKILHHKDENEKKEEKEKKEKKKMIKQMATSMIMDNKSPVPSPQRRHTDTKLKPSLSHSSISVATLGTLSPSPSEVPKPPAKPTGHRRHHSLTVPTAVLAAMEPPKSPSKQPEEPSLTSIPVKVEYKDKVAKITVDISKTVHFIYLNFKIAGLFKCDCYRRSFWNISR
jgi:hypothetical protein